MPVLKARLPGDTWATLGGVGLGVIPGGTTGQVLTKKSAADYDTQWATNTPILANGAALEGYKIDGTTPTHLIGVGGAGNTVSVGFASTGNIAIGTNAQGDINIGSNLAAGKSIYVPRLTVQGPLDIAANSWVTLGGAALGMIWNTSDSTLGFSEQVNCKFNGTAGMTTFVRNVNIAGTLYKGAVAYVHPDFVFEHHFTGGIERFRDAPGADTYEGLWPLARVEEFAQEHWRLPGHAAREHDRVDIFRRTHDLLAELERVYLHLFEHERRLTELEER